MRGNAMGEQAVHQPMIEIEPFLIHRSPALGNDPRPGNTHPVMLHPQIRHPFDVFFETVVVIAGDVSGVAVSGLSGGVGIGVPDTGFTTVLGNGAFDLVGRCGYSPEEVQGELGEEFGGEGHGIGKI